MNRPLGALVLALMPFTPAFAQDSISLDTPEERAAYAFGQVIGANILSIGIEDIDLEIFFQSIRDQVAGAPSLMTEVEIREAFVVFQDKAQAKSEADAAAEMQDKLAANAAFLERNGSKDGMTTTASGLQYLVVQEGEGTPPTADQTVEVHYAGRLLDGTEFDSSYSRGAPATFGVTQVIPGWVEALQLMKPGAKWEVWLPSDIAYGPAGAGNLIGPNEVLNFTIELIQVVE